MGKISRIENNGSDIVEVRTSKGSVSLQPGDKLSGPVDVLNRDELKGKVRVVENLSEVR